MMHLLDLNNIPGLDKLIAIFITFITSSVFSTLITLYITRGVRNATISEAISRYATNITQDAERLLDRLERAETKLETTQTKLDSCLERCKALENSKSK